MDNDSEAKKRLIILIRIMMEELKSSREAVLDFSHKMRHGVPSGFFSSVISETKACADGWTKRLTVQIYYLLFKRIALKEGTNKILTQNFGTSELIEFERSGRKQTR